MPKEFCTGTLGIKCADANLFFTNILFMQKKTNVCLHTHGDNRNMAFFCTYVHFLSHRTQISCKMCVDKQTWTSKPQLSFQPQAKYVQMTAVRIHEAGQNPPCWTHTHPANILNQNSLKRKCCVYKNFSCVWVWVCVRCVRRASLDNVSL